MRTAAGVTGLATLESAWASRQQPATNTLALLADTHIPSTPEVIARDTNMTSNLQHVVRELITLPAMPAHVIVNGDCALQKGLPEDYANFASCVKPLMDSGLSLHLTMGNHDNRESLYNAMANQQPEHPLVHAKHVGIVATPHANLFLLDTLTETGVVSGELGTPQLEWLTHSLDTNADKPAVIIAHHNPQFTPPADGGRWLGIVDTPRLFDRIMSRKHVKAYVFGHTHEWALSKWQDVHLIGLPPVAYVFGQGKPNGWVEATLRADGVVLQLHTIEETHPRNGEKTHLVWR